MNLHPASRAPPPARPSPLIFPSKKQKKKGHDPSPMKQEVCDLMNRQITEELYSAYLYLNFSDFFAETDLDGYAHWFRVQAAEELAHAMRIVRFLLENGLQVRLYEIPAPAYIVPNRVTVPDLLAAALEHEKEITARIHQLIEVASRADDLRTVNFLDWFVNEQTEEEINASNLIRQYELYGADPAGLIILDRELANRPGADS